MHLCLGKGNISDFFRFLKFFHKNVANKKVVRPVSRHWCNRKILFLNDAEKLESCYLLDNEN